MVMVTKNGGCCEVEDVLAWPIRNGRRSHIIVSHQRITRSTSLETSSNGQITFMSILLRNLKPAAVLEPIDSHRGYV